MIKIFFALLLTFKILSAGLVDAIALKVNDDIITLYDIDEKMQTLKISKQQAVNMIVDELLFQQEIKTHSIQVTEFDINQYLQNLARSNNMNLDQFKQAVSAQQNFDLFLANIKQQLLRYKLSQKVLRGKLKDANEADLKIYYENNQMFFEIAKRIDAIKYSSAEQNYLKQVIENPMFSNPEVQKTTQSIDLENSNEQIKYLFSGVAVNSFTKIAKDGTNFVMYYITKKQDVSVISFENVKSRIYNIIMKEREDKFLKEYFNSLRIRSNIEVVR